MLSFIHNLINKFRNYYFIKKNPVVKELIKYSIVGQMGNIIDFGLYLYLTRVFGYWRENYLTANLFGMAMAGILRFVFHKKWTFRDKDKKTEIQYFKFTAVLILNFLINQGFLYYAVEYLNINDILGKLIAAVLTTLLVYCASKYWIFKKSVGTGKN